ncbi:Outer membrane protein TolC [Verrucomicrobium sp. GAS474]|uniref:TolC family protein n=1 Tax=Verrucomicrobium sp. GAS474 TaxID=1882831 RepID=UPI00087AE874|nr:TolC family protein [Verrucomicrobium sp. GAS474]SDT88298.1 Outer membrane protein TolC [Verrucomicrobium sp. GAS474]
MKTFRERRRAAPELAFLLASFFLSFPLPAVEIATTPPPLVPATPSASAPATAVPAGTAGLTLEDCYREALRNNALIRSARAGFENATGQKIVLQSRALPTLTARLYGGIRGDIGDKPSIFAILQSNFYQELFDASTPAAFRKGRITVAVAQQNFYITTTKELNALRLAFYQALAARENVAVQQSIRTRLQANLTLQQQAAAVGRVGKQEVDTASLRLAEIEPTLSIAKGDYRQARIELATHMGRDLDADSTEAALPGRSDLDSGLPLPKGTLESVTFRIDYQAETDYALAHRPDLAALKLLMASSQSDIEMTQGTRLPLVSLGAGLSFIPRGLLKKHTDGLPLTTLGEGIGASWLILDGGAVRGAVVDYQATREGYGILLRQLQSDIPRDLRQIADSLRTASAMVDSSTLAVALAEENYRVVEAQIANGTAVSLDLLNAQTNLLNAQYNRINALLENNTAVAQFDTVTGRYLEFIPQEGVPDPTQSKEKTAPSAIAKPRPSGTSATP